jgi:hypothetical protein
VPRENVPAEARDGFGAEGPARHVESSCACRGNRHPTIRRRPWREPAAGAARQRRAARKKDYENCTTPEKQASEEQPLSMLLPNQREKCTFTASRDTIDRRDAIVIAYREIKKPTVDVSSRRQRRLHQLRY